GESVPHFEMRIRAAAGGFLDIEVTGFANQLSDGTIEIQAISRDITERKRVEADLQRNEREQRQLARQLEAGKARLIAAQAVAKVGSWETNFATLAVTWSEQTHRIFETDPATFQPDHASFLKFVHPDDRTRVDEAFVRSIGQPGTHAIEHRLLPRAVPPGLALAPPETHEEPTHFALALRPLPAVLLGAEPPGRQVRVQGFDGLGRHLELALDVPDPAHRSSV
ncbi:MAG: PAS domain-containing protein, partial [candidate division NC10 bacterium]